MLKQNDEVGEINKKRKATNSDKNDKVISQKICEFYKIRTKHASSVQTKQPNIEVSLSKQTNKQMSRNLHQNSSINQI